MNKSRVMLIPVLLFLIVIIGVSAAEKKYMSIFDDDYVVTNNFTVEDSGQSTFNITTYCPGIICLGGDTIIFNISMHNYGTNYLEILSLWLVDATTGKNISKYNASKIYSDVNDVLKIALHAALPTLSESRLLTYYPCIKIALPQDHRSYRSMYGLERTICYTNMNFSMLVAECVSNSMCSAEESCADYDCTTLNCSPCSFITDHGCAFYECCSPNDCIYNETCVNHTCQEFNCKFYEHIENHECTVLYCDPDEVYVEHNCRKINCSYDEYADNHRCRKLYCNDTEFLGNHSCNQLHCAFDEKAINHTCEKISCMYDEEIVNHACKKLSCAVFQYPKNHSCLFDVTFVKSFTTEFTVWVLILLFLFLIEHLYKKRHMNGKIKNGV
jgi:hypothetical protein